MGYATETGSRSEAVERLHEQLQESLQELVTSEDWRRALSVAARFHDYSFANTRLIWAQSLARGFTPSRVAGYRAWQELGRHVNRGERGLQILAPIIRKVTPENSEEGERRVVGFRVVHVFDLAQTDGEPLPEIRTETLEGDLPVHWHEVTELIANEGFTFEVADLDRLGGANGVTDWASKEVVVRASLSGAQRFKTAVHELAHTRLHTTSDDRPSCRGIVEVEAESVAYVVCAALGIDSASYSLPYVASWSGGDLTKVTATANRVIGCARRVLTEFERDRRLEPVPAIDPPRAEQTGREAVGTGASPSARSHDLEEVLEATTEFYRGQLHSPNGKTATDYLHSRGINDDAIELWQLGYAPDSWRALTTALGDLGFNDEVLLEAGVVGRSQNGKIFDHMRHRIIFPVHDQEGRPRGFAGRLLAGDGPKYLNTPETDLYEKRLLLYGLHVAKGAIQEADHAVVVEGYLDVIRCHQAGFNTTVGAAGTSLGTEHLESLRETAACVTLAFDGDQGGKLAIMRIAEHLGDQSLHLRVAQLPAGRDPADLLSRDVDAFASALASARPLSHHLITETLRRHNLREPEGIARAVRQSGELVAAIRDVDEREGAVGLIATSVGRPESTIRLYMNEALHTQQPREQARRHGLGIR